MQGASTAAIDPAVLSALRWWRDAGADTLVEEAPRAWLRASSADAAARPKGEQAPVRPAPAQGEKTKVELPETLPALLDWLRDGSDVPEAAWGRTRILASGDPAAALMILVDIPEPDDVEAGALISGAPGTVFDNMLKAIGHSRASVWLAPLATARPIGGRVATDALKRLADIARHHVRLVAPKWLLVMGDRPAQALLGSRVGEVRGRAHTLDFDGVKVEAHATFHPKLLESQPAYKKQAWADLQLLMKAF